MSTDRKARRGAGWLLPLLFALPFLAAAAFAVIRFGPRLLELINVAIKGTVVS